LAWKHKHKHGFGEGKALSSGLSSLLLVRDCARKQDDAAGESRLRTENREGKNESAEVVYFQDWAAAGESDNVTW
jgi:hypothetical protein